MSSFLETYFYFLLKYFLTKYFYFYSISFESNYFYFYSSKSVTKKLLVSTVFVWGIRVRFGVWGLV